MKYTSLMICLFLAHLPAAQPAQGIPLDSEIDRTQQSSTRPLTEHNQRSMEGKHGGQVQQVKPLEEAGTALLGGPYQIELVIEKAGEKAKEYALIAYVTGATGEAVNLSQSGYTGISWKSGGHELHEDLLRESQNCMASEGCLRSKQTFAADPKLKVKVVVAFFSKLGTGYAVFEPFKSRA
jgi:hypothetical protein